MPNPRILNPDDYDATARWLTRHGFDGVLPVDAHAHLDKADWRRLKAAVRASRHRAKASGGGPELETLLQAVAMIAKSLIGGSRGLIRQKAGLALLEAVSEFER